jgi:hypothetical protein
MNPEASQHTPAWVAFTQIAFVAAVLMVGIGILFAPVDIWVKGYLCMASVMLVQASITMTKTLRDVHESKRLVNRIEDAKAERLLMGLNRNEAA